MSFARVVPAIRTPLGVEHFDYSIPVGLKLKIGSLVIVPFRKRPTPAVVVSILDTSPFANKAQTVIGEYGGIHFPESLVGLLDWTASWTFSSRPTVFDAWVRNLPKRIPDTFEIKYQKRDMQSGSLNALWAIDDAASVLDLATNAKKKRVLIITPQKANAAQYSQAIPNARLLLSDLADGAAFRAWSQWLADDHGVLVTTRVGAWLSPCADLVLLDQPEQDDHKQDELTPRYDARKLAAWCAQHAGVEVRAIGNTPTIHIEDEAPTIDAQVTVSIRHPNARSPIPMIQPDVLNTLREHEGHRIIIHPIRGDSARFACRDCGWQAVCASCGFATSGIEGRAVCRRCGWKGDAPLECGSCGGYDLGKTLPGIDRLKAAWKKHEADIEVEWRTLAVDEVERPFPEGSMVVITDANLLAGVVEDIRRDERLVIAIRRLAARVSIAKGQLLLQCDEQLAPKIEPWLTSEGYAAFRATERTLRAAFGYPPARRLVRLITEGTIDKAPFELRGPYPVAFRTKSQKNRFIYHILPPKDIQTEALIRHLLPLAKAAIIDLDPIAFFR